MTYAFYLGRSRLLAAMVLVAVAATSLGFSAWIQRVEAAAVLEFSDVLSDSDLGASATHSIFYTVPNGMNQNQSFRIYLDEAGSNFDLSGLTDADLLATSTGFTAVNTCTASPNEIDLSVGANFIQGDVCTNDTIASSTLIGIQIGSSSIPVNPSSAGSYIISLQGNGATPVYDTGDTRVVIIDDVTVTASVDTIFTFSINAVNASTTVNDETVSTTGTTTATTVPFGTLSPGVPKFLAQELRVDTNALNGFNVTVEADQTLTAGNLATIDEFIDGAGTGSSTDWVSPTNTFGSPDTYGHWGLTSDDDETGSSTLVYGDSATYYVGNFIQNPIPVFYHDAAASYTNTQSVGESYTRVGYKIEIGTLQEAGTDYQATLTYVATPVF